MIKIKKKIPLIDQHDKFGFWGGKFGGSFIPETLKKPVEDLEILFSKLRNDKKFILERDKYFKNWVGSPTRFIKLENLTKHLSGAQIWAKVVSDANGGAHKIYNATVHCLIAKKAGKKFIVGDTGAGYAGKMLSMAAKKFGLKCKIFMGAKDIKRQKPNCDAMKKNGAEIVPVYTGSQTLVDAVSECMRYWVSNCDSTHMCVGSTVGPNIFVKICGWSTSQISRLSLNFIFPATIFFLEIFKFFIKDLSKLIDFSYPLLSNKIMSEIDIYFLYFFTSLLFSIDKAVIIFLLYFSLIIFVLIGSTSYS